MNSFFARLFTPASWSRNEKYNPIVEEFISTALDGDYIIKDVSDCTCTLNGKSIWIANRYFAGPSLYREYAIKGYCSVSTAKRLYKIIDKISSDKLNKSNEEWKKNNLPRPQKAPASLPPLHRPKAPPKPVEEEVVTHREVKHDTTIEL